MNIVLDYDGTLHNTKSIYGNALRQAYDSLVTQNLADPKEISDDLAASFLGCTPDETWNKLVPGISQKTKEEVIPLTGSIMNQDIQNGKSKLYPGTEDTLKALKDKGHHLYILSNCTEYYMQCHRKSFNLDRFIDEFYPAERYDYQKKPDIFKVIEKDIKAKGGDVSKENFLVVGDRFHDIETALIHKLHSAACLYGFGSPDELKDAEYSLDCVSDLLKVVDKIEN